MAPVDQLRGVKSARRVADILELVASAPAGMQLADISRALGIPRSSTHALLIDMTHSRLLETRPESSPPVYRIGLLTFEVGSAFLRHLNLAEEARVVVDRLAAATSENAHLAILDGTDVIYVAKAESTNAMRVASFVGMRVPAHATSVGKVLLAELDPAELLSRYRTQPIKPLTPKTKTRMADIVAELRRVPRDGYALNDEESTVGLQCVAAPVRDASARVVAALSVCVPTVRMAGHDLTDFIGVVREHAEDLSRRLGASPVEVARPRSR